MTEENLQSVNSESVSSPQLAKAEASLDNALAALKGAKSLAPVFEKEQEPEEELETESQDIEPKRETLKLPEKKRVETDEPEVQRRINELYKESKTTKESNLLLQDELRKIAERAEQRENYLVAELEKIQSRTTQQDDEAALSTLRSQYQEAIQNFDYDTATKINERIVDFKTEQKLNAIINERSKAENNLRQQQQVRQQKPPVYSDPQDEADANRFQSEKAADGSLIRPWLQQNHPQFQDVIDVMAAVSNGYIRKNQRPSLSAVMQQVDKYMGLGTQSGKSQDPTSNLKHAPVLSSNTSLHAPSDNQANKISDLERTYAAKLGVSDKDYMRIRKLSSSGPISMDNFKK